MIQFKDYYKILDINSDVGQGEIQHAFRKLSLKYHPDINKEYIDKYKEITEAYNVLKNLQQKKDYDNVRARLHFTTLINLKNKIEHPVVDLCNIIQRKFFSKICKLIIDLEKRTSYEMCILIIDKINSDIDVFANSIFNFFGIGKIGKNNGILFLIVFNERKFRIEVGSGLDRLVTKIYISNLFKDCLEPNFKKAEYSKGIYILNL